MDGALSSDRGSSVLIRMFQPSPATPSVTLIRLLDLTSPVPGKSGQIYERSEVAVIALTERTEPDHYISLRLCPRLPQTHTGVPPGLRSFSSQGVHILLGEWSGVRLCAGGKGGECRTDVA